MAVSFRFCSVIIAFLPFLFMLRKALSFTTLSSRSRCRTTRYSAVIILSSTIGSKSNSTSVTSKVPAKFSQFPFEYHQEVEVSIDTLTNRGWGVGRVAISKEEDRRWVVMVPNVIPGERVLVRIFRNFQAYSEGDLVEVLEASPDRITDVPCKYSTVCGGCQLQHMSITAQRDWKTQSVKESLEQYGINNITVSPTVGTEHTLEYRSKLTPHFQAPSKRAQRESNNTARVTAIGFQVKTSRNILDIPFCRIATPAVNTALAAVREEIFNETSTRKKGATLLLRQANPDDTHVTRDYKEYLTTRLPNGLEFTYQAGNFFQNNLYVLPLMVEHTVQACADMEDRKLLVDCYCGSGLFAIACAEHFHRVVGIEINDKAIAEARTNAEQNDRHNCEFLAASAEAIFEQLPVATTPLDGTAVVLDPPRKGCSDVFLDQLLAFGPRRIVYMSCDPTTQARDMARLVPQYSIVSVQPFDLFPQTRHIECLIVLERM